MAAARTPVLWKSYWFQIYEHVSDGVNEYMTQLINTRPQSTTW